MPQRPHNGWPEQESQNNIHGSVYGALSTCSSIGGASCAHAGLRLCFGIALVPVQESWCWLAMWLTFGSANPRGSGSAGSGPGRPSGIPRVSTRIYGYGGGVLQLRRQYRSYSNTRMNSPWRSTGQWAGRRDILAKSDGLHRAAGSDHGRHHWWWVR